MYSAPTPSILAAGFVRLGDWSNARDALEAALRVMPTDGPSQTLMDFMAQSQFSAPREWPGFRELTDK